jgi:hypothetical protein
MLGDAILLGSRSLASEIAIKVGGEFQVSARTSPSAPLPSYPAVASDGDGDFVVVWQSYTHEDFWDVHAQRFSSAGVAQGAEFQVNSYTAWPYRQFQRNPAIASSDEGDFVVAWTTLITPVGPLCPSCDNYTSALFGRRFEANGDPQGVDFQIAYSGIYYPRAAIETDDDGGFVLAWDAGRWFHGTDVHARRFDSTGTPQGTQIDFGSGRFPALALKGGGDFVVAWRSAQLQAQRFDSLGAPQAAAFQVNSHTTTTGFRPALETGASDGFTVVWQTTVHDGSGSGILARRFDSAGLSIGDELQINVFTKGDQSRPAIARQGNGGYVVVWESVQDGSSQGIFARRFDSGGTALAGEFQVNSSTIEAQYGPAVAATGNGGFVVVWRDEGARNFVGQRFALVEPAVLDADADGSVGAITDGLLVLRFLFDFTGSTLTSGAVSPVCNRCDAPAIESYLAGLGTTLDIDGDGELMALIDGVLLLRYLFGFTGDALTTGALAPDCTRCDAAAIVSYLQTLD